ncbi:hypothetical protein HPB50_011032 [Hyalomma asiaticum]|uniref:Uncharacterized protein n=1 Tax=Hyalomma asiaticum TaxID=266040 RepID=A0ACB7RKQ0_HYAAI|nr:hypothetical protein HPB50_011032 [Hyalomma asiaticum]
MTPVALRALHPITKHENGGADGHSCVSQLVNVLPKAPAFQRPLRWNSLPSFNEARNDVEEATPVPSFHHTGPHRRQRGRRLWPHLESVERNGPLLLLRDLRACCLPQAEPTRRGP